MAVGDVNSKERGSGARFNDGKIKMEYIPAGILFRYYTHVYVNQDILNDDLAGSALEILEHLARFEEGTDSAIHDVMGAIPQEHLWTSTCEQFDFGANKYSTRGVCTCQKDKSLHLIQKLKETNTKNGLEKTIQNLLKDSEQIDENGIGKILRLLKKKSVNEIKIDLKTQDIRNSDEDHISKESIDLLWKSIISMQQMDVLFAEVPNAFMSIIAILQENFGEYYVTHATLDLASLRGVMNGCLGHSLTCETWRVKSSGNWNWAKGMNWSIPMACIKRHARCLIEDEEEIDPESGVSHYGAIGCNAVMLAHYVRHYREGDDRPSHKYFSVDGYVSRSIAIDGATTATFSEHPAQYVNQR